MMDHATDIKDVLDVYRVHRETIIGWYDQDGSLGGSTKPYVNAVTVGLSGQGILNLHTNSKADADAMCWLFEQPLSVGILAPRDQAMVDAVRSVPHRFIYPEAKAA